MFTTQINLPKEERTQLVALLNQQLADLSDLRSQTLQAHWNVRGRHFYQHHKLFEELAGVVEKHLDDLAERITTLGGYARGTVRDAAVSSRLEDFPSDQRDDQGYVEVLSARFAHCANGVRNAVIMADELDDAGTADLLTAISRGLDKSLWFLEAHLRPLRGDVDIDDRDGTGEAARAGDPRRSIEPRSAQRTPTPSAKRRSESKRR